MLSRFLLWTGTNTVIPGNRKIPELLSWCLIRMGTSDGFPARNRIPGRCHRAASPTKNLPDTRLFEESVKIHFVANTTVAQKLRSLIWDFVRVGTVQRNLVLWRSLVDTCICQLSSQLGINAHYIAAHQCANLAKYATRVSDCFFIWQNMLDAFLMLDSNQNKQRDSC